MRFQRAAGILLHPTSIPTNHGIGDFGPGAFKFIDFLARSRQSLWQALPLAPTGYGDSPYQSLSAFAGNKLLISPEKLVEDGLIDPQFLQTVHSGIPSETDFGFASARKAKMLDEAFATYSSGRFEGIKAEFEDFKGSSTGWLDDFALFTVIKDSFGGGPWNRWPDRLKFRDRFALDEFSKSNEQKVERERFAQFLFHRQWRQLKGYANSKGVRIVGDLPIFVAFDSADVWTHPGNFKLDADLNPRVVAGVPPDFFSKTGQLWGNPIYNWYKMRDEGFPWWVERVRHALRDFDVLRIDHFRGFCANYEIPGGHATAEFGEWIPVPGHDVFNTLRWALGDLPLIAEDLGFITDDVRALLREFDLPGMKILQYAWGGGSSNENLPHNYSKHCVAYTGTHDNATAEEWFASFKESSVKSADAKIDFDYCLDYLATDESNVRWDLIRALYASVADTVIVPLQDVLGLGAEARMNTPSTVGGNWVWRFEDGALDDILAERLARLAEVYGRC